MRHDVLALVLALALVGRSTAFASEPPATRESAQVPGDLRVLSIEQRPDGKPVAVVALRGGTNITLGAGDALGAATVISISLDEATLVMRVDVDDPRLIKRWRDIPIPQWSSVPLDEMGLAHDATCPTSLLRIEGDVAVFRAAGREGAAAFVRLKAGAPLAGAWRIERVDSGAGAHGVVILRDANTGRRIALASWRP